MTPVKSERITQISSNSLTTESGRMIFTSSTQELTKHADFKGSKIYAIIDDLDNVVNISAEPTTWIVVCHEASSQPKRPHRHMSLEEAQIEAGRLAESIPDHEFWIYMDMGRCINVTPKYVYRHISPENAIAKHGVVGRVQIRKGDAMTVNVDYTLVGYVKGDANPFIVSYVQNGDSKIRRVFRFDEKVLAN